MALQSDHRGTPVAFSLETNTPRLVMMNVFARRVVVGSVKYSLACTVKEDCYYDELCPVWPPFEFTILCNNCVQSWTWTVVFVDPARSHGLDALMRNATCGQGYIRGSHDRLGYDV